MADKVVIGSVVNPGCVEVDITVRMTVDEWSSLCHFIGRNDVDGLHWKVVNRVEQVMRAITTRITERIDTE